MSAAGRTALAATLARQYRAALAMLREAVEKCPDEIWYDARHTNAFWQIAYHALFFTHFYLQPHADDFVPWSGHQAGVQHPDGIAGPADPESEQPLIPDPYAQGDVLAYCDFCDRQIEEWIGGLDLESPESGFYWYPISKLEHQLVNIRHLQHHAAQLADRLRSGAGEGVRWVGSGSDPSGG